MTIVVGAGSSGSVAPAVGPLKGIQVEVAVLGNEGPALLTEGVVREEDPDLHRAYLHPPAPGHHLEFVGAAAAISDLDAENIAGHRGQRL